MAGYSDDNHVARDYIAKNCVLLWKYYCNNEKNNQGEFGLTDFVFYCKYIPANETVYGYFKSGVINRVTREWRFSWDHTSLIASLMASEKRLLELIDEQGLRLHKEVI